MDAQYKVGSAGNCSTSAAAWRRFSTSTIRTAGIYLGLQEPRDKRIRAQLFNLFESNAYFMLDANSLRTGAWVGYDKKWRYGPVKITLEAWLETNVMVNRKPIHFHGDLWAHGKVGMKVFGFGFGLARCQLGWGRLRSVPYPRRTLGETGFALADSECQRRLSLEWGPVPTPPRIPMVLKEVAVEHLKVTTSWPLPREPLAAELRPERIHRAARRPLGADGSKHDSGRAAGQSTSHHLRAARARRRAYRHQPAAAEPGDRAHRRSG